jgi:hypothetical protein
VGEPVRILLPFPSPYSDGIKIHDPTELRPCNNHETRRARTNTTRFVAVEVVVVVVVVVVSFDLDNLYHDNNSLVSEKRLLIAYNILGYARILIIWQGMGPLTMVHHQTGLRFCEARHQTRPHEPL